MKKIKKGILYTIVSGIVLLTSCARIVPYESPLYSVKKNDYKLDHIYSDSFFYESFYSKHYGAIYYMYDSDFFYFNKENSLNKPYSNIEASSSLFNTK